jgi:hypothetical protein
LRATDVVALDAAATTDARAAILTREDTLRATARRVGQRLGYRVLGCPVPPDESAGVDR